MKTSLFLIWICCFTSFTHAEDFIQSAGQDIRTQVIEQEQVEETLKKEKENANSDLIKAENLAKQAKEQVQLAESETEKTLAEFLVLLQSYRTDISNLKLNKIKNIELKIDLMKEKTEALKKSENRLRNNPQGVTVDDLNQATEIWREIVDGTVTNIFQEDLLHINDPPKPPAGLTLSGDKFQDIKTKIQEALAASAKEKMEIEQNIAKIKRSQRDVSARLLLNAGRVRAGVMKALMDRDLYTIWDFSEPILYDYLREVKVVPHRLLAVFLEKYFDFRLMNQEGLRGWFRIFKEASILVLVLVLPFLLFGLFKSFSRRLELFRKQLFTSSQLEFKKRTQAALWIGRLNPYLPWFFAYITVDISHTLLLGTLLEPLTTLLPYLNIYILYRGFFIFFSTILAKVLLSKNLEKLRRRQSDVRSTAFMLSVLFFSEWAFLHAVEDAVRQALIYNLIFNIIIYINIIIIAVESRKWKVELLELSKHWLNSKIYSWLERSSNSLFELIYCPILFSGNIIYLFFSWLYQWISRFEIGKQLSSELLKRRLEEANGDNIKLGKELDDPYVKLFSEIDPIDPTLRMTLSKSPFQKCVFHVDEWRFDKNPDDLILLYGNLGIGKSTLLSALESHFQQTLVVRKVVLKDKIIHRKAFFETLSQVFETEVKSLSDFEKLDKSSKKTLLILDDIHNLYLNVVGGLEAYRTLIELTSLQLENIFWCLSCNERALAHLNGLFGTDHFTGPKIEIMSWTDSEIQDLIVRRHRQSLYQLKFDQVISAVHRGDILESSSGVEVQFFRLLWGQSRGNPSTAQELWLSAATKESNNSIRITVPEFTNPKTLSDLSDETLIIYAAITKHEALSFREIRDICKIPVPIIRQSIKFGEDGMILESIKGGRWRIHPKAQYVVHAQLIGRNFIYG